MGNATIIRGRKVVPAALAVLALLLVAGLGFAVDSDAAGTPVEINEDKKVNATTVISQDTVVKAGHLYEFGVAGSTTAITLTVNQGVTLTVEKGATLVIRDNCTVQNNGTIDIRSPGISGTLANDGNYKNGVMFQGNLVNKGTLKSTSDSLVRFTVSCNIVNETAGTMDLTGIVIYKSPDFSNKGTLNFSGTTTHSEVMSDKFVANSGTMKITGTFEGTIVLEGEGKAVFGNGAVLPMSYVKSGESRIAAENLKVSALTSDGMTVKVTDSKLDIGGSSILSKNTAGNGKLKLDTAALVSGTVSLTDASVTNTVSVKVTGSIVSPAAVSGVVYAAFYKTAQDDREMYNYTSLDKAIASQASKIVYTTDAAVSVGENRSVATDLTVSMPAGSVLTVNAGKTLTIATTGKLTVSAGATPAAIDVKGTLENRAGDAKLVSGDITGYDAKCVKGTKTVYAGMTDALALDGYVITINGNQSVSAATVKSGSVLAVPSGTTLTVNGDLTVAGKLDIKGTLTMGTSGKLTVTGSVESVTVLPYETVRADGAYYSKTANAVKTFVITTPAKGLADMANADLMMMAIYGAFTGNANITGTESVQATLKVFGDYTGANVTLSTNAKLITAAKFSGSVKNGTGEVYISESTAAFTAFCDGNGFKIENLATGASAWVTVKADTAVTFSSAAMEQLTAAGTVTFANASSVKDLNATGTVTVASGKLTCVKAHVSGTVTATATGASVEVGTLYVAMSADLNPETSGTITGAFAPTLAYVKPGITVPASVDALGSISYTVDGEAWFTLYGKSGTAVPTVEPSNSNFTGWKDSAGNSLPTTFGTADITAVAQLSTAVYKVTVEFNSPDITGMSIDGRALTIADGKYVSELLPAGDHVLKYTLKDGRFGTVTVTVGTSALTGSADQGYGFKLEGGTPTFNDDGTVKDPVPFSMKVTYTADAKDIDSLTVGGDFRKEYKVFENFDSTGMTVTAKFANGTQKDVVDECTFEPERFTQTGDAIQVTVKYGGLETSFTVKVVEAVTGDIELEITAGKVDAAQEKELLARIAAAKAAGKPVEVTLDSTGAMKMDMPASVMKAVRDADGTLKFVDIQGYMVFTSASLAGLDLDGQKTVSLKLTVGEAQENQKEAVGTSKVYEISVKVDGTDVAKFGGMVKTVVWYEAAEGTSTGDLRMMWLKDDGGREATESRYAETEDGTGYMEMDTEHFSLYAVMEYHPEPAGDSIWLIVGGIIGTLILVVITLRILKVAL